MTDGKKRFAALVTVAITLLVTAKITVDVIFLSPNHGATAKDMGFLIARVLTAVVILTPLIFLIRRKRTA